MTSMLAAKQLRLPPLPTIRDLIKLYRLQALKQLSQNFLLDERITDRIAKAAGKLGDKTVLEVGPGPGSITRSILKRSPRKVIVVEKDGRFIPTLELLQEACEGHVPLEVVIDDIKTYNFERGFADVAVTEWEAEQPPLHLIGNLPFNVSTHLIIEWLHAISERRGAWLFGRTPMTLTFQKEVAERIVAPLGHDQRCRLSVMCQFWCKVEHRFTIPGRAFLPKPDVDVGVVVFKPRKQPMVNLPFKMVEKVLRSVFNMRQKYCVRGTSRLFPEEQRDELGLKLLTIADIAPTTRPFQISNEEFARLCYAFKEMCDDYPQLIDYDSRGPKALRITSL